MEKGGKMKFRGVYTIKEEMQKDGQEGLFHIVTYRIEEQDRAIDVAVITSKYNDCLLLHLKDGRKAFARLEDIEIITD